MAGGCVTTIGKKTTAKRTERERRKTEKRECVCVRGKKKKRC